MPSFDLTLNSLTPVNPVRFKPRVGARDRSEKLIILTCGRRGDVDKNFDVVGHDWRKVDLIAVLAG